MTGKRIYFTVDDPQGLVIPAFAVRQIGETPIAAVVRAIKAKNEERNIQHTSYPTGSADLQFVDPETGEICRADVFLKNGEETEPAEPGAVKADEYEPPVPEEPRKTLLRPSPTGWKAW